MGESSTHKGAPHDAALKEWHGAHQATAVGAVILGDKERPQVYKFYNEGCIVDLAEEGMGRGGGDLCVEIKAWNSLVPAGSSAPGETSFHGDTHGFGNTEEKCIRENLGVSAQQGNTAWDPATGTGAVAYHEGAYHDAIHVKRNTVDLRLHNLFGGFGPGAAKALHMLSRRPVDRTDYESRTAAKFKPYWGQRISAAIVIADAKRCLKRVSRMRSEVRGTPDASPRPYPYPRCA